MYAPAPGASCRPQPPGPSARRRADGAGAGGRAEETRPPALQRQMYSAPSAAHLLAPQPGTRTRPGAPCTRRRPAGAEYYYNPQMMAIWARSRRRPDAQPPPAMMGAPGAMPHGAPRWSSSPTPRDGGGAAAAPGAAASATAAAAAAAAAAMPPGSLPPPAGSLAQLQPQQHQQPQQFPPQQPPPQYPRYQYPCSTRRSRWRARGRRRPGAGRLGRRRRRAAPPRAQDAGAVDERGGGGGAAAHLRDRLEKLSRRSRARGGSAAARVRRHVARVWACARTCRRWWRRPRRLQGSRRSRREGTPPPTTTAPRAGVKRAKRADGAAVAGTDARLRRRGDAARLPEPLLVIVNRSHQRAPPPSPSPTASDASPSSSAQAKPPKPPPKPG